MSENCEHLWVRRRDGKRCAYCDQIYFGDDLTDLEREKLAQLREANEDKL